MRKVRVVLGLLAVLTVALCRAQWPQQGPLTIGADTYYLRDLHSISDGVGGYYSFWRAQQGTVEYKLFGQHLDSAGNRLWTTHGKLIYAMPPNVEIVTLAPVLMDDGNVMVGFSCYGYDWDLDTLKAVLINPAGNPIWPAARLVMYAGSYLESEVVGTSSIDGAWFGIRANLQGKFRVQRIRSDGSLVAPLVGLEVQAWTDEGLGNYIFPDGVGGMVCSWPTGDYPNDTYSVRRVDSTCTLQWSGPRLVADSIHDDWDLGMGTGSNGSYGVVWQKGSEIHMSTFDTTGTLPWSPDFAIACDQENEQGRPAVLIRGSDLFVAWSDHRNVVPSWAPYMQKFDLSTGLPLWSEEIGPLFGTDAYAIPILTPAADGSVICYSGDSAQRVSDDGVPMWSTPAMTWSGFSPEEIDAFPDGSGGVVLIWNQYLEAIKAIRIYPGGLQFDDTGIEMSSQQAGALAYPVPVNDRVWFKVPGSDPVARAEVFNSRGELVLMSAERSAPLAMDVQDLSEGVYVARLQTSSSIHTVRFIKQ